MAQFPHFNPGPTLRLDSKGLVLLANRAAVSVFDGVELIGRSWLEVCPGLNSLSWEMATAATDEPFVLDADVGDRCFAFQHVRDPGEDLVFVFGADITQRRKAERALAEVARFPDMNPGPVIRMDTRATILLSNIAAQQVFEGDLAGLSWLDVCPGIQQAFWDRVLATTDVLQLEVALGDRVYLFSHRHDPRTQLVFVFGSDITQLKMTERALVQSEKMATLGTLAAGVAHELNNPAAAARRAADQLTDALQRVDLAHAALGEAMLGRDSLDLLHDLENRAREATGAGAELTVLDRSDAESEIEEWLEAHSIAGGWELAPALLVMGLRPDQLHMIAGGVEPEALAAVLTFAARTVPVYALAKEIGESAARISEIVNALRGYSFLGLAPEQDVDLHRGLDDTLVVLNSRIADGVVVRRTYAADIPMLQGFGGELNQVWTHLIHNALDAVDGSGVITITTRLSDAGVEVEIADDGAGISAPVVTRVFDPFFTTKPQGKGTGLGLTTCRSIVSDQHGGSISVASSPGDTRFTVRLPVKARHPVP